MTGAQSPARTVEQPRPKITPRPNNKVRGKTSFSWSEGGAFLVMRSQVDQPQVVLETTQPTRPGTLRPVGMGEEEFLHVIMPMHIAR